MIESMPQVEDRSRSNLRGALLVLTLFTVLTFINSLHDALVFDDAFFLGPEREIVLDDLSDAFSRDLWNTGGELYRPLLSIDFELQNRMFGDWLEGYHLMNVLLHLVTTLVLFGFLRSLIRSVCPDSDNYEFFALLAALVFAVHPVHTEVVNSVFNKSSMYVSLAAVSGLWWLHSKLHKQPVQAWVGFGLIYCLAILFKETALVIPGIAVAMIVLLTEGSLWSRIRRFLPVFWLLIPIAVYFWARSAALAADPVEADAVKAADDFINVAGDGTLAVHHSLAEGFAQFGRGLKILLWPYPLRLHYPPLSEFAINAYLFMQALMVGWAIWLAVKGRGALAFSLVFFYLALLLSIRLIGVEGSSPHIADRYLYFPSVGLAFALAFGFRAMSRVLNRSHLLLIMLPVLLVMAALTWQRNAEWSSGAQLFETEYQHGAHGPNALRILIAEHYNQKRYARVTQICDEHQSRFDQSFKLVYACLDSYIRQDRLEDAIAALVVHAQKGNEWLSARMALISIYQASKQYQKVVEQYAAIIDRVEEPALEQFYKAEMLMAVYPDDKEQLALARQVFQQALVMKPDLEQARKRIAQIDRILAEMDSK